MMDGARMRGLVTIRFLSTLLLGLALAVALTAVPQAGGRALAAGSTPDLALAIDVNGGGDDCDTRASTGSIGTTCNVTVGQPFTMRAHVDSIAGLVNGDGDGSTGYVVFQFQFLYTSSGLMRNNRTGSGEVGPDSGAGVPNYWFTDNTMTTSIGCTPNSEVDGAGSYYVDCWGPGTESTYTGKVLEVDFECTTPGTHTITMDDNGSYIHNDVHGNTPLDKDGNETLTIECATGSVVGGIAEAPDVAGTPLESNAGSGGNNPWLFAGLAAAGVAGASVLGAGVWFVRTARSPRHPGS